MKYSIVLVCLIGMTGAHHLSKKHAKNNKEAEDITDKAKQGLAELESSDASISDMLSFSKSVATGKSANEMMTEQEKTA